MIPYNVMRAVLKISFFKENIKAIYLLNKMFYLLIALYRLHRIQEYLYLQRVYFSMMDSFILYGRNESRELLDQLLEIPWFSERKIVLYQTMASYRKMVSHIRENDDRNTTFKDQNRFRQDAESYVSSFKRLIDFDDKDDKRISELIENQSIIKDALKVIFDQYQV